jgi:hypothetical protein
MAAKQLQLGADDALLCEERDDLVPEDVGIDSLPNPCCLGLLMNDLAYAAARVRSEPIRLEQVDRLTILQLLIVLCQLAPEAARE